MLCRYVNCQFWKTSKAGSQLLQVCLRHSKAQEDTLQPLKVTTLSKKKRGYSPTPPRHARKHLPFLDEDDTPDSLDQLAHSVSKYTSRGDALRAEEDAMRDLIRKSRFIRARTIENKYFKKPSPLHLLTWAAREQIRYLHQQDPDMWSAQELAENFPVSVSSIKKILKSNLQLHRKDDIYKYDCEVYKNWLKVKASMEDEEDPESHDTTNSNFKNSQNDNLVINAMGAKHLPFPTKRERSFNPTGPFSSIVSDCYNTEEQKIKHQNLQNMLSEQSKQLSAVLSVVKDMIQDKPRTESHISARWMLTNAAEGGLGDSIKPSFNDIEKSVQKDHSQTGEHRCLEDHLSKKYRESLSVNTAALEAQHFGRKSNVTERLHVGQERVRDKKLKTFVTGDCVYDQNGNFLYRIP